MGTQRYYRTYIPCSSHPDTFGDWFAGQIPREECHRLAWIASLIEQIDEEVRWRNERGIPDEECLDLNYIWSKVDEGFTVLYEGRPMVFQDIKGIENGMVPDEDHDTEWSYVIDLDNQAFTINGRMHFRLDNMPPGSINRYFWRIPSPYYPGTNCIPTFAHPPSTPVEHIATVSRWPPPSFDISETHKEYKTLGPILLSPQEWGAPTWTNLTTAQQLSGNLVEVILRDSAEKLSNPDITKTRPSFHVCLWQLLSAAAPSHLCLPAPDPSTSQPIANSLIRPLHTLRGPSGYMNCMTPHYSYLTHGLKDENCDHKPYWFRGCLVVFCPRLDDTEYVEYENVFMVNSLRKFGRTTGVGILFSGRHILAVSVDGDTVRCSHPLPLYDAKMNIQDGFLLATHLLSLHSATNKTPWTPSAKSLTIDRPRGLPDELVREITFYLDHEDYQSLGQVSRLFRGLYAKHPRVGSHILLGYASNGNYHVLHTGTIEIQTLHLQRFGRFNRYYKDLVHSFQHISRGPYNLRRGRLGYGLCVIQGAEAEHKAFIEQDVKYKGKDFWSEVYLQVVHGTWGFVLPAEAASNFPGEAEYDQERDIRQGQGVWDQYCW
ncbi:hypothetical protein FRC09_003007 [Ceratobasidium sp. 395]|nr:hypothetical protein FRC09_003007 [Ceratobasidium sp. 395]